MDLFWSEWRGFFRTRDVFDYEEAESDFCGEEEWADPFRLLGISGYCQSLADEVHGIFLLYFHLFCHRRS